MRLMTSNKRTFYYALYDTKEPILDEYGNNTGQYTVKYHNPKKILANISAAKGETSTRQFGDSEEYDRVIALEDPNTPINEYAVLWIDSVPQTDRSGTLATDDDGAILTPWDYVVRKVARGLHSTSLAVSKVNVNG